MVRRDFAGRFKNTHVGMLWSVLNPLLFLAVFYFIFKVVLEIAVDRYASFVFTGILAWAWCQASLTQATTSISSNPGLVSQPGFPVASLPLVAALSNLLNLCISLPVLLLLLFLEDARTSATIVILPIIAAAQLLFILSIGYFVAALNVRFRDVQYVLPILLQLGYYVTPIFYDVGRIGPKYAWVLQLNPMYYILDGYRTVLIEGRMPDLMPILAVAAASAILLHFTLRYFEDARRRFLEEL
ncbi:ABC transporter permease [Allopontixanthobacter sp.]|uniref:ABC transporter permease n=1 Tax=Allopontixanthobacter sp. TaxID=2906452 RepID=UPI002ABC6F22|nr:ABC transporter permease [Allopontixanthobacter sp.]MDZ4306947.1 ABC transporter permease [Allopontixanthobacter sp.]